MSCCNGIVPLKRTVPLQVLKRPLKKRVVGELEELIARRQYAGYSISRQPLGPGVAILTIHL